MVKRTTSWKSYEWRQARRWGSVREGPIGKTGADFLTPLFAVQCKLRRDIPAWLLDAVQNAVDAALKHQQEKDSDDRVYGIAMVKKNSTRMKDDNSLIIMRLLDFEELVGISRQDIKGEETDGEPTQESDEAV